MEQKGNKVKLEMAVLLDQKDGAARPLCSEDGVRSASSTRSRLDSLVSGA
jgi:hypothetical protein